MLIVKEHSRLVVVVDTLLDLTLEVELLLLELSHIELLHSLALLLSHSS